MIILEKVWWTLILKLNAMDERVHSQFYAGSTVAPGLFTLYHLKIITN